MLTSEIGPDEASSVSRALGPIAALCEGDVSFREEGQRRLILMERLRLYVEGVETKVDALLILNHDNASYPTKLCLSERLRPGKVNWNESPYLLGRSWETFSWTGVSPDQSPIEILAGHLQAFTKEW
jgi:hypothetical protein